MEKLEIKHLKVLQEFSNKAHYEEYNSNPVTMFMWNHYYEIYCDVHDRYVLLLVKYPKHIAWLMPLCEEKYLKEAFEQMKKYSDENHFEMSIHGMNKRVKELSEKWGMFVYYQNKDAQDYVYDIEMHKSLVGKKMQKRRNHYNAFMKEYQERFYFRDLVKDDFEMVMSFLDIWKLNHDHLDDIENEIVGIKTLFQYFNELKIHGGCLFIDGELKGFSMYSALSERMIQMHVEKADNSIRGLSVALLKYTLMNCDTKYTLMNREDDLGLAQLRKAKQDLHPIMMIQKFYADEGKCEIIQANEFFLPQIKKMWLASFEDEDEASMDFYFSHLYDEKNSYLLVYQDILISMVQIRFMDLMKDGRIVKTPLVFGVMTHKKYQGCGYMHYLLERVLSGLESDFVLIQAYNWDLYRPFGFHEAYMLKKSHYVKEGDFVGDICHEASKLLDIYQDYVKDKDGWRIRDLDYYQNYFIPYRNLYCEIYANKDAYIVVDKNHHLVYECCYRYVEALKDLLNGFDEIDVICDIEFKKPEIINILMVKGTFNQNDRLYISEIM